MLVKRTHLVAALALGLITVPSNLGLARANGGSAYNPACRGVPGGTVHMIDASRGIVSVEPPAGFDPLSASDAQLACYGFPTRPGGAAGLAAWARAMEHARHYVAPAFGKPTRRQVGVQTYSVGRINNTNNQAGSAPWSGYGIPKSLNGWTNLKWNEVEGEWYVPYGHTYCTNADTAPWVGIGGDGWDGGNGNSLIQGGTDTYNSYPSPLTQFWWEDWNYNNEVPITNMTVHQGDDVIVDVHYNGNFYTNFFYQNLTNNTYTTWGNRYTPNIDQSSANFIAEVKPNPDYVNFGTVQFTYTVAFGTWGSGYSIQTDVNSATDAQFNLYNNATPRQLVAYPGVIGSLGVFNVYSTSNAGC